MIMSHFTSVSVPNRQPSKMQDITWAFVGTPKTLFTLYLIIPCINWCNFIRTKNKYFDEIDGSL